MGCRRVKNNAVMAKLEKGNGGIKGMRVLYAPNGCRESCGTFLIEMEVIGINFNSWSNDGVAIACKPVHGVGCVTVNVTDFIDDTEQARKLYFAAGEAAKYAAQNKFTRHSTDKNWRIMVSRERMELTEAQRQKFDEYTHKKLEARPIVKASEWELKDAFEKLVRIKFGLNELEAACEFYSEEE